MLNESIMPAGLLQTLLNSVVEFAGDTGFAYVTPSMIVMWIVSFVLMYLAIVKKYEPLLLLPISLGALAVNIPSAGFYDGGWSIEGMFTPTAGLYYYISQGIHLELFPPIIFLGVGAMTDFGPLIANPRTLLLGGGAQFGVFATMFCAVAFGGFTLGEAASIGIIGGYGMILTGKSRLRIGPWVLIRPGSITILGTT